MARDAARTGAAGEVEAVAEGTKWLIGESTMFWIREVVGWALLALGLFIFGYCYFGLIQNGRILLTGPVVLMGIFVFRGGIHLLKVAVAARLAQMPEAPKPRSAAPRAR
jgi:hypothetical protein